MLTRRLNRAGMVYSVQNYLGGERATEEELHHPWLLQRRHGLYATNTLPSTS